MNQRDAILEKVREIPALPTAVSEILAMVQDPEVGVAEVMAVVERDPNLTAELLRLANSAYFGGGREIATLRDAGVVLGLNRVLQLILATAVFPVVRQPIRGYDMAPGQLLDHSVAVAVGAETLAASLERSAPPQTFTAGLLHDIGKIVLGTFLEVDAAPILDLAREKGIPFDAAEREILGIDHAEAGAALLEAWSIPASIVEVVQWHHAPEGVEGDKTVVDLVHMADLLVTQCGVGIGLDGLSYRPNPQTLERLQLDHRAAEKVALSLYLDFSRLRKDLPLAVESE